MKALGLGWTMQNAMYFQGEAFLRERGKEAIRLTPPIKTAMKLGLTIGGGTDAHRVMSYDPFARCNGWSTARPSAGPRRATSEEQPSREQALRLYTLGSAWFTHDERRRGSLSPGRLADLAVLSRDYLTMPAEDIGTIESLLTMVGGRVVYAAGPYAPLEEKRGAVTGEVILRLAGVRQNGVRFLQT